MKQYTCNSIAGDIFVGPVYIMPKTGIDSSTTNLGSKDELLQFEHAVQMLKQEIENAKSVKKNCDIFDATALFLDDEAYAGAIKKKISEESCNAFTAIKQTTDEVCKMFSSLSDNYLRERAEDIKGIGERLLQIIYPSSASKLNAKSVIVADELSPAELAAIEPSQIGALITAKGSLTSHVAIMANELGVAYMFGSSEIVEEISALAKDDPGLIVIADGKSKVVTINPDEETIAKASKNAEEKKVVAFSNVKTYVNISSPSDAAKACKYDIAGVGLFRTELLFLNSKKQPTEEEQFEAYKLVLQAMQGKEVVIRTLDIGSDKQVEWLKLCKEQNPALGLRGIRVSLDNADLFKVQLRALLRASVYGNLKVMFPMIASVWEFEKAVEIAKEVALDLDKEGIEYAMPKFGAMIETPAAALVAKELAEKASFFSIGTNDLLQYTLAVDREANNLQDYFNPYHEAVYKLIEMTVKAGHDAGIPVAVCGQLAADKNAIPRLVALGVDELSVPLSAL